MTGASVRGLVAAFTILLTVAAAHSDPPGSVTACASDTQLGAGLNLAQALGFGGVIRFQCPPGTIIRVRGPYVLKTSTLIDGGDAITLDGRGGFGPMLMTSENIILRRLTVRGFGRKPTPPRPPPAAASPVKTVGRVGGSVLTAFGNAELDHVNIETSDFPVTIHGIATVTNAVFTGNRGGATLSVNGTAHIEHSRFIGNGQALSIGAGWVRSCDFINQTSAAVRISAPTGPVEVRHSTFSGIRGGPALLLSQRAGRPSPQTVTIRANVFRDNDGGSAAGAIALFDIVQEARGFGLPPAILKSLAGLPPASFVLSYNRFNNNHGARGGAIAADLANTLGMVSTGDLFVSNSSNGDGGAIVISGGAVRISHSLFKANRAGGHGAALAVLPDASAVVSNTLVVRNVGPSGAIAGSAVNVVNVTVADNDAVGLLLETRSAQAANVLLAHNHPSDCQRVPTGVFSGGGMQSDGSCPGVPVGEAFLDPFYVPAAGSPALHAGDPAFCRGVLVGGVDLPFQGRPNSTACALGAFEGPPLDKLVSKTDRPQVHATPQDDFPDEGGYHPTPSPPSGSVSYSPSSGGAPPYGQSIGSGVPPSSHSGGSAPTYNPSSSNKGPSYKPPPTARAPSYPPSTSSSQDYSSGSSPKASTAESPWWKKALTGRRTPPAATASASPIASVRAALAAEAAAPIERVHMFMTRDKIMDDYYIDRVGSRRFHLRVNPHENGPELIVFDGLQWARTNAKAPWRSSPALDTGGIVPSLADLFAQGLSHAVEKAAPNSGRSVEGTIAWANGGSCEGKLLLRIDSSGLPSLLHYDGVCDGKALRFHQAFSYAGPLTIAPPQ